MTTVGMKWLVRVDSPEPHCVLSLARAGLLLARAKRIGVWKVPVYEIGQPAIRLLGYISTSQLDSAVLVGELMARLELGAKDES